MTKKSKDSLPQFFPPKRDLKHKVGSGGLNREIVRRAQEVIEENNTDFIEFAAPYMSVLNDGIAQAKEKASRNDEEMIEGILFPAMQLKANGELFHYPIVTVVGGRLLTFLERIHKLNGHALEIVDAFEASIKLIFVKKLKGDINKDGETIVKELDAVCDRFFEKYPENIHPRHLKKRKSKKPKK
ncbi:MAG: hypothetical protein ACPG05_05025 [Bdellovibrionales bacterium]